MVQGGLELPLILLEGGLRGTKGLEWVMDNWRGRESGGALRKTFC